ncbi:MAG: hypothetical protein KDI82_12620, partial [Gammaproteobacteria bacterium]|nr:hypothetical protein [Gammaproteobacteria bacterium]
MQPDSAPIPRNRLLSALTPGFLRRLDRWLLLHWPWVWRTRVHYFAWYSLVVANIVLLVLAALWPIEPTSPPDVAGVTAMTAWLTVLGWTFLLLWISQQLRPRLGPRRARILLLTGLLYCACFYSVAINPLSFALPITQRIASLVPDDEFAHDLALHQRYDFWCCHPDLSPTVVAQYADEIERALEKYVGVRAYTYAENSCVEVSGDCIRSEFDSLRGRPDDILLRKRMLNIESAKQLFNGQGEFHERFVMPITESLSTSLVFALALTLATSLSLRLST